MSHETINIPHGNYSLFLGFMADEASYSLVSYNIYRINQILVNINYNDAKDILSEYLDVEDIKDSIDVKKLASLILWLKYIGLKVLDVGLFEEPYFIEIDIDECDWEEWDRIAKRVKEELIREGMEDIAGKVAIVCPRAL